MPKTTGATSGFRQFLGIDNVDLLISGNDKLGYAFPPLECDRLHPVVDQQDLYLTAVIGIDRSGAVEAGYAMFGRQAAPRTDLALISFRYLQGDAGRHKLEFARSERHWLARAQIQ